MIHLTLNFKKNTKILLFETFLYRKIIIFVSKNKQNFRFFLNMGQLKKMQKSAKGLISFFCQVYVSPLIGKKFGSGKARHWEKLNDIWRVVSLKITQFKLNLALKCTFLKSNFKILSIINIDSHISKFLIEIVRHLILEAYRNILDKF